MKKIILLSTALFFSFILNAQVQIGQTLNGESVQLGRSVSISSDGTIIAVGEIGNSDGAMFSGQVRVYENVNNTWIQIGQGINGENELDNLGFTVSLSASGTIIAVGTPFNQDNGSQSGQVRVYENINNNWIQIGQDINGEEGDLLGFENGTAISADGNIIAVGARRNDENGEDSGQVKVFENINNIWTQIGQNINGEAAGDQSGYSVSLSEDGHILAIGAPDNSENGTQFGHVRIFENVNNVWAQIGQDIDGDSSGFFGLDVSLSSQGNIVAIGAPFNNSNGDGSGQVQVYENINNVWTQIGQNVNGEFAGDASGFSVSLSSSGNIIAVGAPNNDENGNQSGQVRIFENINNIWTQIGQNINGEAPEGTFGFALSLSSQGNIVVIGDPFNDNNGQDTGQVRVFDLSALLSTEESTITQFDLFPNPAKDFLNIQLQQGVILENINIYNNLGQFIQSSKESIIDTSGLISGLYFVEVSTNQEKSSRKLIIE